MNRGLGRWGGGGCASAAADRVVEGGEIGGNGAGSGGGDDGRLRLVEEPLDGLAVGLVAQFSGQLEDPGGAQDGHADAAPPAIHLGVPVFRGLFGNFVSGCRFGGAVEWSMGLGLTRPGAKQLEIIIRWLLVVGVVV